MKSWLILVFSIALLFNISVFSDSTIPDKDPDGTPKTRIKMCSTNWTFQYHTFSFSMCDSSSVYNKDISGNDLGFVTYKMFKADDTETADPALCVKTQVDWMTTHDIELIGANLHQNTVTTSNIYMYVVALPGITNTKFAEGGLNLKHVGAGNAIRVDGRTPKLLLYNNPIPGTNKIRFTFKHNANENHPVQIAMELCKP